MSASKKLAAHYTRLLSLWPTDALRATSFKSILTARLAKHSSSSEPSSQSPSTTSTPSPAPTSATSTSPPAPELVQINALYSLLENRYSKKYKLSSGYLRPSTNPEYYENLAAHLERAPQQSRWQNWVASWKGYLRFQ